MFEAIRNVSGAPKPVGAYSPAIVKGDLVFVSGQIGLDPETGEFIAGGVREQTEQVLKNLAAVLQASGSSPHGILMTTIFLSEIADAKVVNELYGLFVDSARPPARQTVAVKQLPLGALVEISLIASR